MTRSGGTRIPRLAALALAACTLTACTNSGPLPIVSSTPGMSVVPEQALNEVVVGVDDVKGSYNPHTIAGQSTITTALTSLLLPSVFRTAPDGTPRLDTNLMVSAQVTKTEPYTVSYTLRKDASWTDTAPMAAEDFVYLWQRMRSEPGVVDPAGYRLISDIASREGGKAVEVTFSKPYPGWRSLFSNLLPAHLLKDQPGGWATALSDSFPATGGPFAVKTLDVPRGEIVLERNDRYWEQPTALDRVVLRRASHDGIVSALRDEDDQAALIRADAIALNAVTDLSKGTPLVSTVVPRPEVVQVLLRPASEQLADLKVRQAVLAALDREALIAIGTGSGPSAQFRADSMVVPPSKAGYAPTIPAGVVQDVAATTRLLGEAGYVRPEGGVWSRDGKPLSLTIAAVEGAEPYNTVANQVQRQLVLAGIQAKVISPPANQLFGQDLPGSPNGEQSAQVDITVVPQVDTGDSAASLASAFGCRPSIGDGSTPIPANLPGFCDQTLQPVIDDALSGRTLLSEALTKIEPVLWQQAIALPLFQVADFLVVLPEARGAAAGAPFAGPLSDAATWRREQG
ncbi:ABC transporter family substrate-binding protein [Umezawaea sp. Da 62-37]|uniref:ABC transporter family substrate-binding protein n=1 Tax=Umezawaea sp. Da 62-37 TaxID=3075927 RepID=UPI0037DCC3D3